MKKNIKEIFKNIDYTFCLRIKTETIQEKINIMNFILKEKILNPRAIALSRDFDNDNEKSVFLPSTKNIKELRIIRDEILKNKIKKLKIDAIVEITK